MGTPRRKLAKVRREIGYRLLTAKVRARLFPSLRHQREVCNLCDLLSNTRAKEPSLRVMTRDG